jgi:hypothetical protein
MHIFKKILNIGFSYNISRNWMRRTAKWSNLAILTLPEPENKVKLQPVQKRMAHLPWKIQLD